MEIEPSSPQSITQQLDWVCNRGMDEASKCAMAEAARKHALGFDRAKVLRELMSLVEGQQDDQGEEGEGKGGNETDQNL